MRQIDAINIINMNQCAILKLLNNLNSNLYKIIMIIIIIGHLENVYANIN